MPTNFNATSTLSLDFLYTLRLKWERQQLLLMTFIAALTDGDEQCEISVSQKQFIIVDICCLICHHHFSKNM